MNTLKDFTNLISGFQGKVSEGNDYKQIKLKNVTRDGNINYEELETFKSYKVDEKYILKKNDIILKAKSGDNTAAIINEDMKKTVATAHFIIIRIKDDYKEKVNPEYLAMYLNSEYAQNYFISHREGIVTPILKLKTLENLPVKNIDIKKQKELAKIYRLLNEEKETMKKLIEEREKQFKLHLKNTLEEGDSQND